ncbi:MAG: dockerin type I repeat-containing protein [Clostridia bacterium]|nr:dockerin type I repeat-containing protein [Clostridia bacterium]
MNKKIFITNFFIIFITIILFIFPNNIQAKEDVFGDINGDGKFDQIDLSRMIRHVVGLKNYIIDDIDIADLNEDYNIDIIDISMAIKYIINNTVPQRKEIVINRVEDNYTYSELKQMMQNEIAKKDFSDLANQFLMEIFEELYQNYPSHQKLYKDFPNTATYINRNLINVIKDINSINLCKSGTDEANEVAKYGGGYTTVSTRDVYLIYGRFESESSHKQDLESLFHEIIHVKQVRTKDFSGFDYQGLLVEGGAAFNSKFMTPYGQKSGGGGVEITINKDTDDEKNILFFKQTYPGNTYAPYVHAYEMLEYALGYDLMDYFEHGNVRSEYLKSKFYEKSGVKLDELSTALDAICNGNLTNSGKIKYYNYSKEVENAYLDMMKNELSSINASDKTSIKKFIDVYRNYKQRIMPFFYKGFQSKEEDNLAYQELNVLELDNLLIDKIINSGTIKKLSNNNNLNRMAIRAIVKDNRYDYYRKDKIYKDLHLPDSMDNVQYVYFENEGNGHLVLKYNDYSHGETYMEYTFNETDFVSIEEASTELQNGLSGFKSLYE